MWFLAYHRHLCDWAQAAHYRVGSAHIHVAAEPTEDGPEAVRSCLPRFKRSIRVFGGNTERRGGIPSPIDFVLVSMRT